MSEGVGRHAGRAGGLPAVQRPRARATATVARYPLPGTPFRHRLSGPSAAGFPVQSGSSCVPLRAAPRPPRATGSCWCETAPQDPSRHKKSRHLARIACRSSCQIRLSGAVVAPSRPVQARGWHPPSFPIPAAAGWFAGDHRPLCVLASRPCRFPAPGCV